MNRLLLFDALAMEFREVKIRRDPECPLCGDNPTIHELIDYEAFCGGPRERLAASRVFAGEMCNEQLKYASRRCCASVTGGEKVVQGQGETVAEALIDRPRGPLPGLARQLIGRRRPAAAASSTSTSTTRTSATLGSCRHPLQRRRRRLDPARRSPAERSSMAPAAFVAAGNLTGRHGPYRDLLRRYRQHAAGRAAAAQPEPAACASSPSSKGQNPTGSVKDRIARKMIERAERTGELTPGATILLEPTSGNTGIALAMIARLKGYRLHGRDARERERRARASCCELYGAEIVLPTAPRARTARSRWRRSWPPRPALRACSTSTATRRTRAPTTRRPAPEIIARPAASVDVFVAGLGTGGTLTGVGRCLKEHNPRSRSSPRSRIPGDLVQGLRSLDEGFIPPILDLDMLDRKIVVASDDALDRHAGAAGREGIFAGISSGAALAVRAPRRPSGWIAATIVVLLRRRRLEVPEHRALDAADGRSPRGDPARDLVVAGGGAAYGGPAPRDRLPRAGRASV